MSSQKLPASFCWTKMGTEAGQPLDVILARKEAERVLGQGIFLWGIGNALGPKLWQFVDTVSKPLVFFTTILGKPREVDVRPKRVVAWSSFFDREGLKHNMPEHALVTSRAAETDGRQRSHFALVCKRDTPLQASEKWTPISWRGLSNYRAKTPVASSQVTAIVEKRNAASQADRNYEVLFAAELVPPYYVRLTDPVDVPISVLAEINGLPSKKGFGAIRWRKYLDNRFPFRKVPSTIQLGLFNVLSRPDEIQNTGWHAASGPAR